MKVAEHATQRYTLGDEVLPCNPSIMAAKGTSQSRRCGHARKSPVNHTTHTKMPSPSENGLFCTFVAKINVNSFYWHTCIRLNNFSFISLLNVTTRFKHGLMYINGKQKEN